MKKLIFIALIFIGMILFTGTGNLVNAQQAPFPPSEHGLDQNAEPSGPTAPIDGGLSILLILAAGYAFLKIRKVEKR